MTYTVTVEMKTVEERIETYFNAQDELTIAKGSKPRRALTNKKKEQMVLIVKLVILPQIVEESFRLDISDDAITKAIGVTPRRAQALRHELKDAGIVWTPKSSRSKKQGEYPTWLMVKELIKYIPTEPKIFKPAGPKTSKTYNQDWCDIWDWRRAELARELRIDGNRLSPGDFQWVIQKNVNDTIAMLGLTKEDFLK